MQNLDSISPFQPRETKQENINAFLVARNSAQTAAAAAQSPQRSRQPSQQNTWQQDTQQPLQGMHQAQHPSMHSHTHRGGHQQPIQQQQAQLTQPQPGQGIEGVMQHQQLSNQGGPCQHFPGQAPAYGNVGTHGIANQPCNQGIGDSTSQGQDNQDFNQGCMGAGHLPNATSFNPANVSNQGHMGPSPTKARWATKHSSTMAMPTKATP